MCGMLRNVIIVKLPFAVPDEPLTEEFKVFLYEYSKAGQQKVAVGDPNRLNST